MARTIKVSDMVIRGNRQFNKRKPRTRARKTYKRKARPRSRRTKTRPPRMLVNPFHRDVARVMYPHDGEPAVRFPDGQSVKTMAVNITTTGIYYSRGFGGADTSGTVLGPHHASALYVFPGSIHYPLWLKPTPFTATTRPQAWSTLNLGPSTPSSLFNKATGAGLAVSEFSRYRVTGATFAMTYLGNNDNSAGEIIGVKFDPKFDNPLIDNGNVSVDNELGIPVDSESINNDGRLERLPSAGGIYMAFHKSTNNHFGLFKDVEPQVSVPTINQGVPLTDLPACSSLEAAAIFFRGTTGLVSGGVETIDFNSLSIGSWRWELVQTVEFVPKSGVFTQKLATEPPANIPMFHTTYDIATKLISDRALDIVPVRQAPQVRALALGAVGSSSGSAARTLGSQVPSLSVDQGSRSTGYAVPGRAIKVPEDSEMAGPNDTVGNSLPLVDEFSTPVEYYNGPYLEPGWTPDPSKYLGGFTYPGSSSHCGMGNGQAYPTTMDDSICSTHDRHRVFNNPDDPYAIWAVLTRNDADVEYVRKYEAEFGTNPPIGYNSAYAGYLIFKAKLALLPEPE